MSLMMPSTKIAQMISAQLNKLHKWFRSAEQKGRQPFR